MSKICKNCGDEFVSNKILCFHQKTSACSIRQAEVNKFRENMENFRNKNINCGYNTPNRKKSERVENESLRCAICMDNKINTVSACGHVACNKCSRFLKTCHICREPWVGDMKLYI